jgi:hypothetical protein
MAMILPLGFMSVSNPRHVKHLPVRVVVESEDHTRERLEPMVIIWLYKVVLGCGN